ncbi:hypothetical protein [Coleofasciculus chthonoplastes]|uniref:hypothetical protein n=1 Tax=Coleofasciculus chthonoplastes TaxID=64178 RepID=UPI0032FA45F9
MTKRQDAPNPTQYPLSETRSLRVHPGLIWLPGALPGIVNGKNLNYKIISTLATDEVLPCRCCANDKLA